MSHGALMSGDVSALHAQEKADIVIMEEALLACKPITQRQNLGNEEFVEASA